MKIFISILAFIVAFWSVGYIVDSVQVKREVEKINDVSSSEVISRAEGKIEFMEGCDTGIYSGPAFDQTRYCGCVYDKLVEKHGVNGLLRIVLNESEEEIQSIMADEVSLCLAEQNVDSI